MFHFHNGHELSQIDKIYNNVTDNIASLAAELDGTRKRLNMSQTYLEKVIS